ncbi:YiiD C-terminal domain-containing protein [Denitrificimonas sp. JX-1]|uniref:YiiD C-terminal domain-containing protein n=1 Tax=Denitrificimonas halotolerans TaxID=3098930 RepID=A0ABU5GRN1_9GAMM|nr:YiiD C-terminal domain-containing protein [Denitrificimonas sp. JX-1]MDY7219454.1 YiiD C-terminal domain-containing protein [Denitrificimonas sp. JX-1]
MPSASSSAACQHLAQVFASDIPLTLATAIEVRQWEAQRLQLMLPLQENRNHQNSMFGGSLYCAAVLAGWGWLHLRLRDEGIDTTHIVVQAGQIDYPLPVYHDAEVVCTAPDEAQWKRFFNMYKRHGKARISLTSRVLTEDGQDGAIFTGQFVLHN